MRTNLRLNPVVICDVLLSEIPTIYNQLQINDMMRRERRERLVSNLLLFCILLGGEFYQFVCNLPLILRSIISRSSFSPFTPPHLKSLVQTGLTRLLMFLDLMALNVVNLVEYHLILQPALLLLSALGDEVRLEAVRERLSQFSADGEEEEETKTVSEVLEDLIQKVVESQEVVREHEDNKLEQSVSGPSHESGYLSEIDMAE